MKMFNVWTLESTREILDAGWLFGKVAQMNVG